MREPRTKAALWIDQPAQLLALVSPVRQEIVDVLATAGPAPIARLAELLGRPADGLYFHVRRLVRCGLLQELAPRGGRGRVSGAVYDLAGRPLRIRYGPDTLSAIERVMHAALRLGARDLSRALGRPRTRTQGRGRNFSSGRFKAWLGAKELRRVGDLLDELRAVLQAGRPGPRRQLLSFTFVLAPVDVRRRVSRKGS
jgi:hypothetical protein